MIDVLCINISQIYDGNDATRRHRVTVKILRNRLWNPILTP